MSRVRVTNAHRTRGTSEYQVLSAATLALVEQYQRRLDTIEDHFRDYHTEVESYKAGVDHALSVVVSTQNQICAVLEHLPNQLQARCGNHAPSPPPSPPPPRRRRRRHRNRRRLSPSSLPPADDAVDEVIARFDAGCNHEEAAESSSSDEEDDESSDPEPGGDDVYLADLWPGLAAPVVPQVPAPPAPPPAAPPVLPVPTVASLRPPPVPISAVERLMATERVPDFDTKMPVSLVSLLADWRARRLGAYESVKGKQSRWGISIAQAYGKRLYLMGLIRATAPNAHRPDNRIRTRVEMEDLAAVEMDRGRIAGGQTSMASYYAQRKRNDTRTDRRKTKNSSDEGGI